MEVQLRLLRQQSAGQENDAEQNVKEVVHLRQVQRTYVPHPIHSGITQHKLSQESQGQVNDSENKTKRLRSRQRPGEPKVESHRAGYEMDEIMRGAEMETQQGWRGEAGNADKQESHSQELADSLCHDLCLISSTKVNNRAAAKRQDASAFNKRG